MASATSVDRIAVLIPGRQLGPHVALLMYGGQAAIRRGARVQPIYWNPPTGDTVADLGPWVRSQVAAVLDKIADIVPDAVPLLIGKSLGSQAATIAAERGLPAVWLTPILSVDEVSAAVSVATAPVLLVGGTADNAWDGKLARELSPHVLEIDGADHGMFVQGPLTDSVSVLGRVVAAVEKFIDDVVWPSTG